MEEVPQAYYLFVEEAPATQPTKLTVKSGRVSFQSCFSRNYLIVQRDGILMKEILTVSQLNETIKKLLEEVFGYVFVEGEISNLRRPQSGHTYFTLKDEKSQIRAVCFKPFSRAANRDADFGLEDGLSVLCRARLSAYTPRGEYQLIVESVEPRGIGALQKAFEQLKGRLAAEGLFERCYKKDIPFLPQRIGVVTSSSGVVIKDILNITLRRFPSVDILVAPCRVQGIEATVEIIQGLRNLHAAGVDVIIIARGGGSLEDMAPFNSEALAREIFCSHIPIISAVGHETDFTICDFAADVRAPTPSAAAELAVPDAAELVAGVKNYEARLIAGCRRLIMDRLEFLTKLQERMKDPRRILIDLQLHSDDLRERMLNAWHREELSLRRMIQHLDKNLLNQSPADTIIDKKILLNNFRKDVLKKFTYKAAACGENLQKNLAVLNSLNPLNVLQRGYSIARNFQTGEIIKETSNLNCGEKMDVRLAHGHFHAEIMKIFQE
jgi:exodeoxyribonuclease VII large subunit